MTRLGRLVAVASVLLGAMLFAPGVQATHCPPEHYQHPPGVPDDYPCPDPDATPPPDTPEPTPTPAATVAPTPTPALPAATRRPATTTSRPRTSAPAINDIEVPTQEPSGTPEIIVEGPVDEEPLDVAEPSASASSWIFGFIVGLIIGAFAGRASWGLRRRRRQQIFG